jgi:protein-tyrosine phosphatase
MQNQGRFHKFISFAAMKILMVCLGNICRSPMAEGILKQKAAQAGLHWKLDSAGTTNGYHVGEAPHHLSQKVARLHGIDISRLKARLFIPDDFIHFDRIYAMSEDVLAEIKWIAKSKFDPSKVDLLMNEVHPGQNLDIPDPWYGPEPGFHEVYKMIEKACEAIVQRYSPGHSPGELKSLPEKNKF